MTISTGEKDWAAVVQKVVTNIADRARAGGAKIVVDRQSSSEQGMTSIAVTPEASGAAAFSVTWENSGDLAYVSVGEGTTLEVPESGGRYTGQGSEMELRALLLAVVEGRFSERVWLDRRGRVLAARARFDLPEQAVTVTTAALPWLYRLRRSETHQYLPYY